MRPIVLISTGDGDADFTYATGFSVENALYIRFDEGDDVIVTSPLEIDRARAQSTAGRKLSLAEAGFEEQGPFASYARLAAKLLRERDLDVARVSAKVPAGYLEELRAAGLDVEVDRELFRAERRHKSPQEARFIEECQRAAEAAVVEVVSQLAQADLRNGILWLEERPLTSERLYARASLVLGERGFSCPDMIIAGSPECAMPHYRGEGPIKAGAPIIIDVFPSSRATHYHGDLTRTVVVGDIPEEFRRMHAAAVQALDAGLESIRAGVSGRDVHHSICEVLVDRGYGTTTKGFEGASGVAKMSHSTGHGVGLAVHEDPALRGPDENVLLEGDVVTVEPGLYLLGLGGVRVEDTGMVTKHGFKNFTTLTRSLDPRDYL
ncbi:MAG: Xaa-Pro peptidase family protein [Candidatus Dormibacteraceae bacterium]